MRIKIVKQGYIFFLLTFLLFGFFVQAEKNKIINVDDLENSGLSQEKIDEIKSTINASSISVAPEITSPSLGAVISSKDILFKGVATPNVNITIYIKDIDHAQNNTIVGKAKSDNFGVWSHSLSSELSPSNYTVMATANDPELGTVNSEIVKFSIISKQVQNTNQMQVKDLSNDQNTEKLLFMVIIVGMVCFTFLVAFIILMIVFYLKEKQKTTKINLKEVNEEDLECILNEIKKQNNIINKNKKNA